MNLNDPSLHPSRPSIFRHVYWLYKTSQVTKTVHTVKISKQTKPWQSDFPQSIDVVVGAPAPLDTSSTVPIVCMALSLIPVQAATPVDMTCQTYLLTLIQLWYKMFLTFRTLLMTWLGISWCIQILQHLYITSLHQDKIHQQ